MKKLMALFVMLVLLSVCAPSYCAPAPVADLVLVYKVTISGKVVDKWDNEAVSAKVSAYLVLSIDENIVTGAEIINAGLVLYGKLDGRKIYDKVDYADAELELINYPDDVFASVIMEPPNSAAIMFGKIKLTDIGLGEKRWIPTSLSGGMLFNGDFFGLGDFVGSGTISAKLDSKLTKANVSVGSTEPVVSSIVAGLVASGYSLP